MASLKREKIWPKWMVEIGPKGEILFELPNQWNMFKLPFIGKQMELVMRSRIKERSRQEEKYYRGVVIRLISEALTISPQEAHSMLGQLFLRTESRSPQGIRYFRTLSTTELSDEAYRAFVFDKVIPWAGLPSGDDGLDQDHGLELYIPLPNEVDYEDCM